MRVGGSPRPRTPKASLTLGSRHQHTLFSPSVPAAGVGSSLTPPLPCLCGRAGGLGHEGRDCFPEGRGQSPNRGYSGEAPRAQSPVVMLSDLVSSSSTSASCHWGHISNALG